MNLSLDVGLQLAHFARTTSWHRGDIFSALLVVLAVVGVTLAVSDRGRRDDGPLETDD